MEYYVKSVVPIIESNYDKFTTVERNIADFFIQNRKKVDFSAKSIAERLFVSEASLSRFAKKCVEISGAGVVVHVRLDLVDAGERMQHDFASSMALKSFL